MSGASARLELPLIEAGQAAKELTHNEALTRLDLAVQASVVALGTNTPPNAPGEGDAWIAGTAPTGAWAGQAQALAGWTASGWRFVRATEGMTAWVRDAALLASYREGAWTLGEARCARVVVGGVPVVQAQATAIADAAGGATVDGEARTAIAAILAALRHHGLIAG